MTDRRIAAIVCTDMVSSTAHIVRSSDAHWCDILEEYERIRDARIVGHGGRLNADRGDGFLATFATVSAAIDASHATLDDLRDIGIALRVGVHVGEISVRGAGVAGLAVNIASRVMDTAEGDEVVVSSTVHDMSLGAGLRLERRGARELPGVPGMWSLYAAPA